MGVEPSAEGRSLEIGLSRNKVHFSRIVKVLFRNILYIVKLMGNIYWCHIFIDWTNFCLSHLLDVNLGA